MARGALLTLYGPYILESVVHDGFAFIKKGGFPYVKYGNNWHVKGKPKSDHIGGKISLITVYRPQLITPGSRNEDFYLQSQSVLSTMFPLTQCV